MYMYWSDHFEMNTVYLNMTDANLMSLNEVGINIQTLYGIIDAPNWLQNQKLTYE